MITSQARAPVAMSQAPAPLTASQACQSGLFLPRSNDGPFDDHPQGQTGRSPDDKPEDDEPQPPSGNGNISDDEDMDKDKDKYMQANNNDTIDDDGPQYDNNLLSNLDEVDGYT